MFLWTVLTWEALSKCRWLIRRLQGFASIICDTILIDPINSDALLILMAKLSGAFTKGTELTVALASGAGPDLQACSVHLHCSACAYLCAHKVGPGFSDCMTPLPLVLSLVFLRSACMRLE